MYKRQGLEATEEDVDEEFKKAGVTDWEAAKAEFLEDGRMPAIRVSIRRNKAIDWLLDTAVVTISDEPEAPAETVEEAKAEEAPKKKSTRKSTKKAADAEAPAAEGEAAAEEAPKKKTTRKSPAKKAEAKAEDAEKAE